MYVSMIHVNEQYLDTSKLCTPARLLKILHICMYHFCTLPSEMKDKNRKMTVQFANIFTHDSAPALLANFPRRFTKESRNGPVSQTQYYGL